MNRLVILGNGFDLAHGLPTSYKDFIFHYIISGIKYAHAKRTFENDLISIKASRIYGDLKKMVLDKIESLDDLRSAIMNKVMQESFEIDFKGSFLGDIFEESSENELWLDIEKLYYKRYKEYFNNNNFQAILKLNNSFEHVKKALAEYLENKVDKPWKLSTHPQDLYTSPFLNIMRRGTEGNPNKLPSRLLLCSFNYTTLSEQYSKQANLTEMKPDFINIHGRLDKQSSYPLIFGYGDESDKIYQDILDQDDDEFTRHFKHTHYHLNDSYPKLRDFFRAGSFEVYLMGHSCGAPDATLLREIFEHEFCNQIVLFHHKSRDNYSTINNQVMRKFNDRNLYRERIVSFNPDNECPQFLLKQIE